MTILFNPATDYPLLPGGGRESAPKSYREMKLHNFTLHHIAPYRYACLVGLVLIKLHEETVGTAGYNAVKSSTDSFVRRLLADESAGMDLAGFAAANQARPRQLAITRFGWMGPNLFMGPEGSWRLDDPKHGPETLKPRSLNKVRWDALQSLYEFLDNRFDFIEQGGGCKVRPKHQLDCDPGQPGAGWLFDGSGLLTLLAKVAATGENVPHAFTLDDWVVVGSADKAWKKMESELNSDSADPGTAKELLRSLIAAKKVEYFRPTALTKVYDANQVLQMRAQQAKYRDAQEDRRDQEAVQKANEIKYKKTKDPSKVVPTAPTDPGLGSMKFLFGEAKAPSDAFADWRSFWRLRLENESTAAYPPVAMNFRVGGAANE